MKKISYLESIEERPIDRDYNEHGKTRQTHYEIYGGGIAYCVRSGYQPEILFMEEELTETNSEPKIIQKYGDRDKDCGYSVKNYSNCIPANPMSDRGQLLMESKYRIRKLTENECFKLMGFTSEDCEKCKDVGMSKTQLYKQAGNSIVTNCIQLIWEHIYKSQYDPSYVTYDENFTQAAMG